MKTIATFHVRQGLAGFLITALAVTLVAIPRPSYAQLLDAPLPMGRLRFRRSLLGSTGRTPVGARSAASSSAPPSGLREVFPLPPRGIERVWRVALDV